MKMIDKEPDIIHAMISNYEEYTDEERAAINDQVRAISKKGYPLSRDDLFLLIKAVSIKHPPINTSVKMPFMLQIQDVYKYINNAPDPFAKITAMHHLKEMIDELQKSVHANFEFAADSICQKKDFYFTAKFVPKEE